MSLIKQVSFVTLENKSIREQHSSQSDAVGSNKWHYGMFSICHYS